MRFEGLARLGLRLSVSAVVREAADTTLAGLPRSAAVSVNAP